MNRIDKYELPQLNIKELRTLSGMTQLEFSAYLMIPINTIRNWESDKEENKRECKPYILNLIESKLVKDCYIDVHLIKKAKENKMGERLKKYYELMTKPKDGKNTEEINLKLKQISNLVNQLTMDDIARAIRNSDSEQDKSLYKVLGNYLFMNSKTTIKTIGNIKK